MMKTARYLLFALALFGVAQSARAQGAFDSPPLTAGGPPPAFAADPAPPQQSGPEFCPAPQKVVRTSAVPFDPNCPVGNAFTTEAKIDTFIPRWYFGLGGMALRRTSLSKGTVAIVEQFQKPNADAGTPPGPGSSVISGFQDLPIDFSGGIRGQLGYNFGPNAIEISGFTLVKNSSQHSFTSPGQVDVLFGFYPPPTGFTGDNNLWLQADKVTTNYSTTLGDLEFNYRYCVAKGVEIIGGFRYLDLREKLSVFTDDTLNPSSPLLQANYAFDVHNRIIAPQLGFECEKVLVPIVSVGVNGKAAIGPNILDVHHTLTRGDGFQGPGSTRNEVIFSSVAELGLFTNFYFNDQFRLRLGYNFLWVLHVPEAQRQFNFNPNIASGNINDTGSILFHGPMFEFQVAF